MDDLLEQILGGWLVNHPHVCALMVLALLPFVIHLYIQTSTIRRIIHSRKLDWLWLQGPRSRPRKR